MSESSKQENQDQIQTPSAVTEVENVDMKMVYTAVIELTKQIGQLASQLSELRTDLSLKKRAGNF